MKSSRKEVWIYFTVLLILLSGCGKISQGLQRKKFEFLYKLNNYTALFSGYTSDINYFEDLKFYNGRMKKLYEDVNKIETIDGYGTSRVLRENFLNIIDLNVQSAELLMQEPFAPKDNIRKEYGVIIMNERVDKFLKELNDEISVVGKEE